jgi:hypothetical protein
MDDIVSGSLKFQHEYRVQDGALWKTQGCNRHGWVERNWPRDGEETDRKGLSRGCELSEHYVRYRRSTTQPI